MMNRTLRFGAVTLLLTCMLMMASVSWAQSTNASGAIQGTVTDQSGAVLSNATVTITNTGTGQKITRNTTDSGTYSSGPLSPGDYTVRVETRGFQSVSMPVKVQIGSTLAVNPKLQVGA